MPILGVPESATELNTPQKNDRLSTLPPPDPLKKGCHSGKSPPAAVIPGRRAAGKVERVIFDIPPRNLLFDPRWPSSRLQPPLQSYRSPPSSGPLAPHGSQHPTKLYTLPDRGCPRPQRSKLLLAQGQGKDQQGQGHLGRASQGKTISALGLLRVTFKPGQEYNSFLAKVFLV